MVVGRASSNPEKNPHLFVRSFGVPIRDCKPKIAIRVLTMIIGRIPDAELRRIARKATKHLLGKKTTSERRDAFRRKCLKKLRAMKTKELRLGISVGDADRVCD